jgi:hypothetical protein
MSLFAWRTLDVNWLRLPYFRKSKILLIWNCFPPYCHHTGLSLFAVIFCHPSSAFRYNLPTEWLAHRPKDSFIIGWKNFVQRVRSSGFHLLIKCSFICQFKSSCSSSVFPAQLNSPRQTFRFIPVCYSSYYSQHFMKGVRVQLKCDGTRWRTGGEVKEKLANGVGSQYSSHYLGTWCIQLPVVDWTDAPADLNGLVRFAERRNLVSARVPSHSQRSLLTRQYFEFLHSQDKFGGENSSIKYEVCKNCGMYRNQVVTLKMEAVSSSETS